MPKPNRPVTTDASMTAPALQSPVDPAADQTARRHRPMDVVARVLLQRLGVDWLDLRERSVFLAVWSIGGSLAMATWKIGAAILVEASLFWLTNAAFSLGLAAAKWLAIVADRPPRAGRPAVDGVAIHRRQHRMYRLAGAGLCMLAMVYIVSCLSMVRDGGAADQYDRYTGIAIATLTFTELGFAIVGLISARRSSDLVVEIIKLSNLAGALVLLVLTQTALMSFTSTGDVTLQTTGLAGLVFGTLAGLIGLYMLLRRLPDPDLSESPAAMTPL